MDEDEGIMFVKFFYFPPPSFLSTALFSSSIHVDDYMVDLVDNTHLFFLLLSFKYILRGTHACACL